LGIVSSALTEASILEFSPDKARREGGGEATFAHLLELIGHVLKEPVEGRAF
jgi:hypothetical protein